jgi:excisionase family DNA binding protein
VDDELLTVDEAASRLKMHPVTIRRLLREGKLPGRKVGAREWRISAAVLRAFIEGGQGSALHEHQSERLKELVPVAEATVLDLAENSPDPKQRAEAQRIVKERGLVKTAPKPSRKKSSDGR